MDDFTFPAIPTDQDSACRESFPHFAASPLWFLSSAAPDEGTEKIVDSENKMDMLWEDFNEEFRKVSDEPKEDAKRCGYGWATGCRVVESLHHKGKIGGDAQDAEEAVLAPEKLIPPRGHHLSRNYSRIDQSFRFDN